MDDRIKLMTQFSVSERILTIVKEIIAFMKRKRKNLKIVLLVHPVSHET